MIATGDTARLEQLLPEDITVLSDGGGKATAFRNPILGQKSVIALLLGLYKKLYGKIRLEPGWINHQPALFYYEGPTLINCQIFSLHNGKVNHIFFIRNPDKLQVL